VASKDDVWQALLSTGEQLATEAEYEHGYQREVRQDLARYVTFKLANEVYGLPIHEIVEISKIFGTTPVPRTQEYLLGIGNVRGDVIPVLSLARRLSMPVGEETRQTRVLIVNHRGELYGLVVDEVLEVASIPPEDLEEAPGGIGSTRAEFILALGRRARQLYIILDLSTVLDVRDFVILRHRPRRAAT